MTQIACRILLKRRTFIQLRHWGFCFGNSNWIQSFCFGQSLCNCYFDRSCNSVIFSPHKINFGILATLIANRIFTQHFSTVFGGLKYLKFFGIKEAEYLRRFLLACWEGFILSKFICLTWVVSWITFNSILNTKYWEPNKTTSLILWFNCCSQEFQWFESSQD